MLGCDAGPSGAVTHGHVVAATALGNATDVDPGTYGAPWYAIDGDGASWKLDGVAPGAVLVAYDAQRTPAAGSCGDPLQNTLTPGDIYSGGSTRSLGDAYANHGARVLNLSWGTLSNMYDSHAMDVDQFLLDKGDAMVFIAVGNASRDADNDGVPDPGTVGAPATSKNGLAIGASRAANDRSEGAAEDERAFFSSVGPAPSGRIAPQLMAPGDEENDTTNMGVPTEYACASSDSDQLDPVECNVRSRLESTSFATAAASGAALLVRDYFAQGFYPDGTSSDPDNPLDQIANVSGALVKAALIASADYMTGDQPPSFTAQFPGGDGLTVPYRFNNEQGYGRIALDRVLPLEIWPAGVSGLLVQDSVVSPVVGGITGLAPSINTATGGATSGTFPVCNPDDELRIALAWFDVPGQSLINDLDLEVQAPSGARYRGNYFTDDDNRNGILDPNEDCPSIDGTTGATSASAWSLPICQRGNGTLSPFDRKNPTEAVMLSPDPLGTGQHGQIETGTWIVRLSSPGGGSTTAQKFAVVIAGGVCQQSWVRLDAAEYACNASAGVAVYEVAEIGDVDPDATDVSSRTTIQVLAGGIVVDEESGLDFTQADGDLHFDSAGLLLTPSTARDPGNGVLDVRDGDRIRVLYDDTTGQRSSEARVGCTPSLGFGGVVIGQFGQDASFQLHGGCERNARGLFEYGFPDRYLDASELATLEIAFASYDPVGLNTAEVDLRCVIPDLDSPADCAPPGGTCADPQRANNPSCDQRPSGSPGDMAYMTILDTPRTAQWVAPVALRLSFGVQMAPVIPGTPEVELVLSVRAATAGKTTPGLAISRHRLDVDEQSLYYSTDFPTGGTEYADVQNDEVLQNPTSSLTAPDDDYRFETRVWSDLTAGGTKNQSLRSPWNFDISDGGFRSGILATTSYSTITNTIAQWGEDLNFNGILDRSCSNDPTRSCLRDTDCTGGTCTSMEDRDPVNLQLDQNWNIRGGCGWQTKPQATCSNLPAQGCTSAADCPPGGTCTGTATGGGIWHTGRIGAAIAHCAITDPEECYGYETVSGTQGLRAWREALVTPVMQKVNGPDHRIEIMQWAWNQAIDLADNNVALAWEFDTDTTTVEPADLYSDNTALNSLFGPYGAVARGPNPERTDGYSVFAPLDASRINSVNGTVGNNRQGRNSCYFGAGQILSSVCPNCPYEPGSLGWARPLDDDLDNDGDNLIDEFVTANGPIRNMDISAASGPDMRFDKLEDIYGDTGETFQAAVMMWNFEKFANEQNPLVSYGIGIDDMVVQWREYTLTDDTTDCAAGECAAIDLKIDMLFERSTAVEITVLEKTPDAVNDCDLDGTSDGTVDCNGNGVRDVVVRLISIAEPDGEIMALDASADATVFRGELSISTTFDAPGILFVGPAVGGDPSSVTATYLDLDDGTGAPCGNDLDPAFRGRIQASVGVLLQTGDVRLVSTWLTDNGDDDGFADTNETAEVRLAVWNRSGTDLTGVTAHVVTSDPKVDCILRSAIYIGDLPARAQVTTGNGFVLRVADVDRTAAGLSNLDDLSATFDVTFAGDQFQVNEKPQSFTLDLDLDAVGGGGPTTYFEGFESGTFGAFEGHNMDATLFNLQASDGYRCQYHDPDWVNSNSYGYPTDCFVSANPTHAANFFWQVNTPAHSNHGKAFSGNYSLYMGIFGPTPDFQTTPVSVMEAVRLRDPINLGATGPASELSYKHQVDLIDGRSVGTPPGDAPSRYVAMLQLADGAGNPLGHWIKLEPYLNVYDQTANDNYFNCSFDPIDDGNTEDDFFDPTDPDRRLGPSSMCRPELNFTYIGETFRPFDPERLGNASDGPGLQGSLGVGTWIETRFSLERFRGRRARLRFINTDLKLNSFNTNWAQVFTSLNPGSGDDGIWIDDVEVTNTLTVPSTITNDVKPSASLPGCGNTCNVVTAKLEADPPSSLPAPGQVVELSALDSVADRCLGGVLQFGFWIDGDGDGIGGGAQDTRLRAFSEASMIVQAPAAMTRYVVDVRCSSDPACIDSAARTVFVDCPTSGSLTFPEVLAPDGDTLDWGTSRIHDFAVGRLADVSTYATTASGQGVGPASSFDVSADQPPAGQGLWYLFRDTGPLGQGSTGFCNAPGITWGSASRDATLP